MANFRRFGAALPKPEAVTGPVKILPDSKATADRMVAEARVNEARMNSQDAFVEQRPAPETREVVAPDGTMQEHVDSQVKLSKLVADDFPFDDSQLTAINGLVNQRFGCLTGAAGTGKTTTTKKLVQELIDSDQLGQINLDGYFKKSVDSTPQDDGDDYEEPKEGEDKWVPSVCLVGFTGRSSQMIKKNFPRDWHPNIMTIHRMLAFVPEFYEDFDPETGGLKNKMRFTPTYNKFFKLPWDVIIIDEAGMVSIELWNQVWDACKPGTRIIMIGDINQLPPVHGRSIFGFAMTKWPSWELTHIHRQEGVNNSIVDNAWSILKGQKPKSDNYQQDPTWKFAMMPIPEDSALASQKIRAWLAKMNGGAYQPHRDSVITAINGEDASRGYALGQIPMNRELAIVFNKENPRYIIDAGRERKHFAVGDKVMATRNDHEVGITNGMTGKIMSIELNGAYAGDHMRFGKVEDVSRYMQDIQEDDDEEFSLDDISDSYAAIDAGTKNAKDKKERGPASHVVTVRFGEGDHAFEIPFQSLAEVASLMTAYVVTCHKMQGGESPLVVIICHQAHKAMLNREWLYTAVTRASQKCVLFFTDQGLRAALSKQRITGRTLQEKVKVFQDLQTKGLVGAAVNVFVPEPESFGTAMTVAPVTMVDRLEDRVEQEAAPDGKANGFAAMLNRAKEREAKVTNVHIHGDVHVHVTQARPGTVAPKPTQVVKDKGVIYAEQREKELKSVMMQMEKAMPSPSPAIVHQRRDVVPSGPVVTHLATTRTVKAPLQLTYQPIPVAPAAPVGKPKFRFGGK